MLKKFENSTLNTHNHTHSFIAKKKNLKVITQKIFIKVKKVRFSKILTSIYNLSCKWPNFFQS